MYFSNKPYGLDQYLEEHKGDGSNMLRGEDFAQPRALQQGDTLSNGWQLAEDPSVGYNSSTNLHFVGGITRVVAPRLPLQLLSDRKGVLPSQLRVGQILKTACVVLEDPTKTGWVAVHHGDEVLVKLTGGFTGHVVGVPNDLELAISDEEFPTDSRSLLGDSAMRGVEVLYKEAKETLMQSTRLTA